MTTETLQEDIGPSVGQLLKSARLAHDLNLEAIAKSLRISKRHLAHLEEDDEELVCDVYTLGFLKSYAQYLELDASSLIQKFKIQTSPPQTSHLTFPTPLPERGRPNIRILFFSFFISLAVILMGWKWFGYYQPAPYPDEEITFVEPEKKIEALASREIKPVFEQAPLSPAVVDEAIPSAKGPLPSAVMDKAPQPAKTQPLSAVVGETPQPAKVPSASLGPSTPSSEVLLKTTEEAWIEVRDNEGHVILSRLFRPGETYHFKNPKGLVLTTGNSGGTHLISGEKTHTFSEGSGIVKVNVPLDPEKWVEQSPRTH